MFFYIAFILLIIIALGDSVVKYFYKQREFDLNIKKKNTNVKLNKLTITLLYITFLLLIAVCFSPYIFTRKAEWAWADLSQKGDLGDAIGGMTSPFIGVASVIITGLAFYMQYTANKLQVDLFKQQNEETKKQFNEQLKLSNEQFDQQIKNQVNEINRLQFESQFYERLRLLKEELYQIKLVNNNDSLFESRQVFYELDKELKFIYLIIHIFFPNLNPKEKFVITYDIFYQGRKLFFKDFNELNPNYYSFLSMNKFIKLNAVLNDCYNFLKTKNDIQNDFVLDSENYWEINIPRIIEILKGRIENIEAESKILYDDPKNGIIVNLENDKELYLIRILEEILSDFENKNYYIILLDILSENDIIEKLLLELYSKENFGEALYSAYLYKYDTTIKHLPFQGMYTKLSLIFRQIFGIVKFITNNNNLNYQEKRSYLRILRSILGNYEQLHIFYNWYGDTAIKWEEKEGNRFFTDYRIIHNLPLSFLIEEINILSLFDYKFEHENDSDSLFELLDWYSE